MDETIRATIIKPNQAIKLRARKETLVSTIYFAILTSLNNMRKIMHIIIVYLCASVYICICVYCVYIYMTCVRICPFGTCCHYVYTCSVSV